jgi:hypothetical protein
MSTIAYEKEYPVAGKGYRFISEVKQAGNSMFWG